MFASVARLWVKRSDRNEGNAGVGLGVGEPVPGGHTFDGDSEPITVGRDGVEERTAVGGIIAVQDGLTAGVEDAQVHAPGVQIDAAVESVRLLIGWLFVKAHHGLLALCVCS